MNTLHWDPTRTRWNSLQEREDVENQWATLLGLREVTGNGSKESLTVAQWSPLVDILETAHEYLVKVELPAMKKEDLRLRVEDERLTISGDRKLEKEGQDLKHHRIERASGPFMRSFTLPENTDGSKVTADYREGMLYVHLPKAEQATAKALEIKVS